MPPEDYFVRNYDIDVLDNHLSLELYQKSVGDVGCVVWDASLVLAKYLEVLYKKDPLHFKNLKIVELGAGVGCVGLTAACLGANVVLTDLPEITPLLEKNLEANRNYLKKNQGKVRVQPLQWGETTESIDANLIVLADCIYYKESIDKLILTLKRLYRTGTSILMSQEMRDSAEQKACWMHFVNNIQKLFTVQIVPISEQNEDFRSEDILLIKLTPLES